MGLRAGLCWDEGAFHRGPASARGLVRSKGGPRQACLLHVRDTSDPVAAAPLPLVPALPVHLPGRNCWRGPLLDSVGHHHAVCAQTGEAGG